MIVQDLYFCSMMNAASESRSYSANKSLVYHIPHHLLVSVFYRIQSLDGILGIEHKSLGEISWGAVLKPTV